MPVPPCFPSWRTGVRHRLSAWICLLGLGLTTGCQHGAARRPLDARAQAREYLTKNQPERALPLLEAEAARAPEDLELARTLTEAHVKAGQAEAWIAELLRRNGQAERAVNHYMLGLAYFSRVSDAGSPAVAAFQRALELKPDEPEFHYRLGLALLESEQYAAAVGPLRRAAELAPERAGIRLPLAKALHRTGDEPGAVAALSVLVRKEPSPAEVATARALMNQLADPFTRFPKAAESKLEEGMRYLQELDAPHPAIIAFEEILRDYPDLAVVHALMGLAWQRLDDAGRAVEEFKRAIELAPADGKNHFYLGELYLARQRPEAALPHLEKAVELNPLLDMAWFRLGDIRLERKDLKAAGEAFRVLTHLEPDEAPPRGKLALVLQLEGDWAGAERELKHVVDKDPENLEFTLRLGILFTEQARQSTRLEERREAAAKAEQWLGKVLEAQPENAVASRALQQLKRP
ncbi:Tetratricopeptide repeat protein [Cystobacter fuscus DSM 2262]|uniref:Tetratricopeptide repeat protein n=1 Tax=Cystobacter fuscus (strain ATCC 25194 / DSM 2262 / NBRC 100088 / M29) TaxID=1242864 RepID=S9P629_CYSF2|nr:tetratricopeptide repeat protein [Cystobacter fuscus]EPX57667.1 Tetratricopeptide repeat protein [Cystobacter fuscus DSM 2262]